MCGLWAYIQLLKDSFNYEELFANFMNLKSRGPDMTSFNIYNNIMIGFHRLAIMEPAIHTNQPYIIKNNHNTIVFVCNGEIYNFKELISQHNLPINDNSDCMTIPQLYIKYGLDSFLNLFKKDIKGEYAFLLFEFNNKQELKNLIVGRDHIGIRPLYYTKGNNLLFASEIKGMGFSKDTVYEFEPGTLTTFSFDNNTYQSSTFDFNDIYNTSELITTEILNEYEQDKLLHNVKISVINSVKRRLMADRPIAFLLSGGVDSSLVAGISAKEFNKPINTYCCGMNEGTDLLYARKVANYIKSNHTEVIFTPEEGLEAIYDVIYTTETWDTTTIRASIGQYLVCRHIGNNTDAKVVMVGEGPDEVCSSYLFNYNAPDGNELHHAAIDYVAKIHMYDGRRADRCIARWGLEGRIALLDPEFISAYWFIPSEMRHPKYKGIEKWWLRKAFENTNTIPNEVLWRKKEAFSDGVSGKERSWFEILQDFIKTQVTEEEWHQSNINAPSLEAYYYKKIFIEIFGTNRLNILPHYWQPKWQNNDGKYIDPSARVLNVYTN